MITKEESVRETFLALMRQLNKGEAIVIKIDNTNLSIGTDIYGSFYIKDLDDLEKEIVIE